MIIYMIFKWGGAGGGGQRGKIALGGLLRRGVQNERNFQKGHSSNNELWHMHNVLKNSGKFIMFSDKKSLFWDLKIKYLLRVSEFLNHT